MSRQPRALNAAVADLERALAGRPAESVDQPQENAEQPDERETERKSDDDAK